MEELFSHKLDHILSKYDDLNAAQREEFIVEQFLSHFTDLGYKGIKFKVEFTDKRMTSHYLLFVSKNLLAYFKMKKIMAEYSDYQADGVPWMGVNNSRVQDLFADYSIVKLKDELTSNLDLYSSYTIERIYERHSIGKPYIKENYKQVIVELIREGKAVAKDKNGNLKSKPTYTNHIFPNHD